jgi:hypothetical protein
VSVVGFYGRFNIGEGERPISCVGDWLGLDAPQDRGPATLPPVGVGKLTDNVFIATLTVRKDSAKVSLGSCRRKERRFKAEQCGDLLLQLVDRWIVAVDIVAEWRIHHGRPHFRGRAGYGVTAEVDRHGVEVNVISYGRDSAEVGSLSRRSQRSECQLLEL